MDFSNILGFQKRKSPGWCCHEQSCSCTNHWVPDGDLGRKVPCLGFNLDLHSLCWCFRTTVFGMLAVYIIYSVYIVFIPRLYHFINHYYNHGTYKTSFLVSFAGFSELFTQIYWVGWFRMDRKIPPHPSSLRSNPSSQNHRSGNRISASNLSQDPWLIDRKSVGKSGPI